MAFDLLTTVEYGGCSAKLSPKQLEEVLNKLPIPTDPRVMVGVETHDDAGVYRLNDTTALIFTTDFFPPICSDSYRFGQIAAANALSDVYAMGGTSIMALNIIMFPSDKIPMEEYSRIMDGGQDVVAKAGATVVGGHTIEDYPPKYGLAVIGTIHPDKLITNAGASVGQKLILTKPIGSGVIVAAHRLNMVDEDSYNKALDNMIHLNKEGAEVMQQYGVKGATDVTGFALAGHALKMADASDVSMQIEVSKVPLLDSAYELVEEACIPGALFRNREFAEGMCQIRKDVDPSKAALMFDAQTSGGLLMAVPAEHADQMVKDLVEVGYETTAIIGEVVPRRRKSVYFI